MRWGWILGGLLLVSHGLEARVSRTDLAEAWAPILYKDISPEFTQSGTGFNPVDHLVGLFFDGNEDLRDNGESIFRLDDESARNLLSSSQIYYAVQETKTHWYLNYILYHAIDLNIFRHTHDTENIWLVLKKNGAMGELEFFVTNAHGYPQIYGPKAHEAIQGSGWKSRLARLFLPILDKNSKPHHLEPDYESLHFDSGAQSLKFFVAAKTHAIYKFSSSAWRAGHGQGVVYLPQSCQEVCEAEGWLSENPAQRISYRLVDWDKVHRDHFSSTDLVFTDKKNTFGVAHTEAFFPKYLVPGFGESEARALVFHAKGFKTRFRLNDPARVHQSFVGSSEGISTQYIYNPYLDRKSPASNRPLLAGSESSDLD